MAEVTDVDIVNGIPQSGSGTVPTLSKTNTLLGAVTETAPASDTASSGLNGRLQRLAQNITALIALFYTPTVSAASKVGVMIQGVVSASGSAYGSGTINPLSLTNTGGLRTHSQPATTGGYSHGRLQSLATTNTTSLKASAGQVYAIQAGNNHATNHAYLKLYNKASAPTVGTDVPVETILIPATKTRDIVFEAGAAFATGIAYAITGGAADTDTTAVLADQVTGSIKYA